MLYVIDNSPYSDNSIYNRKFNSGKRTCSKKLDLSLNMQYQYYDPIIFKEWQ